MRFVNAAKQNNDQSSVYHIVLINEFIPNYSEID